jgi:type IV pilus assembly protein PilV
MITRNSQSRASMRAALSGFTLLEVLIAIVVVAFGLLGLAGLQVFALKNNQSASMRIAATALSNDIIDRMKANFLGVVGGNYNRPSTADYNSPVASCNAAGCTPSELAQNDLREWQAQVAATLPGGVGIVCIDSTPSDPPPAATPTPAAPACDNTGIALYTVKIWWEDDRSRATAAGTRKYLWTAFNP